jgi:hypothetical protein
MKENSEKADKRFICFGGEKKEREKKKGDGFVLCSICAARTDCEQ